MSMTSFERVLLALQGKPQPSPPFTLTLSLYGARLIGCPLSEYYRRPERYLEGQEAVFDLCRPDIIFSPFALTLEAEAFGCELKFLPDNPPNTRKPAVRSADDFIRLPLPDVNSHPSLLYLRESTRLLAARYRNDRAICGVVTASVDLPAMVMGIDQWIETLLFAPEMAVTILEKACCHFVALANALLADGANFIALPTMFTNPQLLYPQLIDEVILPAFARSLTEVKGPIVFHHGGNPMVPSLGDYLALPNVAAYAVDHRDSLTEARRILGPDRLLLGNLNGPTLSRMSMDTVLTKVAQILDDRRSDPCFIFATSGADVPFDTPPVLLQAISAKIQSFSGAV
jgi:uroporphyrinogen decarboxylase